MSLISGVSISYCTSAVLATVEPLARPRLSTTATRRHRRKGVGDQRAGDAGADDEHVGLDVAGEARGRNRRRAAGQPYRTPATQVLACRCHRSIRAATNVHANVYEETEQAANAAPRQLVPPRRRGVPHARAALCAKKAGGSIRRLRGRSAAFAYQPFQAYATLSSTLVPNRSEDRATARPPRPR